MVLRFPDVVRTQIRRLQSHFAVARARYAYRGPFHGCFPVKSCHDVDVIRAVVGEGVRDPTGAPYGLEVGSKAELALAIARFGERAREAKANARAGADEGGGIGERGDIDQSRSETGAAASCSSPPRDGRFMIVCNGRKDARYVRLACLASALGAKVVLIVESGEELEGTLDAIDAAQAEFGGTSEAVDDDALSSGATKDGASFPPTHPASRFGPLLGLRARLDGRHPGRFGASSGPGAKFGLGPAALLRALDLLRSRDALWRLKLLHYHAGSQAAAVSAVRASAREASRIFCELTALGAPLDTIDVGGGLAVAYDGTGSAEDASTAYSLAEYADAVVDEIKRAVDEAGLPEHPRIVAEAGRAVAIHHAVTIVDVLDGNKAFHGAHPAKATDGARAAVAVATAPAPAPASSQASLEHLSARPGEASYSTLTSVCPIAPPAEAGRPAARAQAPLPRPDVALLEVVADAVATLGDARSEALLGASGRDAVRGILEALVDLGVAEAKLPEPLAGNPDETANGSGAIAAAVVAAAAKQPDPRASKPDADPYAPRPTRSTSSEAPRSVLEAHAARSTSSSDLSAQLPTPVSQPTPESLSRAAERAGSLRVSCVRAFERRAATLRARALCDEMAWAAGSRAREAAERLEAARLCGDANGNGNVASASSDATAATCTASSSSNAATLPPCAPPPWAHLNLNVFRSLADAWGMGQIFPIVPLDSLDLEPSQRVALADLTCDSEGKVSRFARPGILPYASEAPTGAGALGASETPAGAGARGASSPLAALLPDALSDGGCASLRIHPPAVRAARNEPYTLGIFMTGVYQDVLGGPHNMLGTPHSIAVECTARDALDADASPKDAYRICTVRRGETVSQVLDGQGHGRAGLEDGLQVLVQARGAKADAQQTFVDAYAKVLDEYTYLHM